MLGDLSDSDNIICQRRSEQIKHGGLCVNTDDDRIGSGDIWNNTKPTRSHFSVGNNAHTNTSSKKYIAYLALVSHDQNF